MTMTKTGNKPELDHPGRVKTPPAVNPYDIPADKRWAHDCASKVPPVVRSVATEAEMKPVDPLKQFKSSLLSREGGSERLRR
jgi:hypothetical protein